MLDFRMDTFLAVCQYMNYTRAAQKLNLTQPGVSQHIRWLEEQYGVRLFRYANRRLTLTQEGEQLRAMALTMKHDTQSLQRSFHEPGPLAHRLVMGVTPTVGMYLIPRPLARYHSLYPDSPISVQVSNTQNLCAALDRGELDFAIVEGYFCKSDYDSILYRHEPYLAICGADYKFQREPKVLSDLLGETLIVREPGSGNREIICRALSRENLTVEDFRSVIQVSDMNVLKEMLLLGCGVGFLYQAAARPQMERGVLRAIPLENFHESHDITFLWRKGSVFARRYRRLHELLLPVEETEENRSEKSRNS